MNAREMARGKWQAILAHFIDAKYLRLRKQQPCPMCGGTDRYTFTDIRGMGDYFCRGCGHGDGFDLLRGVMGWDFAMAAAEVERVAGSCTKIPRKPDSGKRLIRCGKIWDQTRPVTEGSAVHLHLKSRGLSWDLLKPKSHVRAHPRLRYYDEEGRVVGIYPAMVAKVSNEVGFGATLHVTYLTNDGRKADVPAPRKILPPVCEMNAVQINPREAPLLGVAEGIETALAASVLFGVTVWAALSAGQLAKFDPPPEVRKVLVFGDNDPGYAGQAAAYELARRLSVKGIEATVHIPQQGDWNDELQGDARWKA